MTKSDAEMTIVTVTHDGRREWLLDLIDAIHTYTPPGKYELVVVDNASRDGTAEALRGISGIRYIRNLTNLDCSRGLNQGLATVTTPYAVNIDTDAIVFREGWLEEVLQAFGESPRTALVGSRWNPGFSVPSDLYAPGWDPIDYGIPRLNHIQGGFLAIRTEFVKAVGLMNEVYVHNYCDVEWSYRALSFGWDLTNVPMVSASPSVETFLDAKIKVFHPIRDTDIRDEIRKCCIGGRFRSLGRGRVLLDERAQLMLAKSAFGDARPQKTAAGGLVLESKSKGSGIRATTSRRDLWLSVTVRLMSGSVVLKLRAKNDHSDSYHIVYSQGHMYLARSNHRFGAVALPYEEKVTIGIACAGLGIHAFFGGRRVLWAIDRSLADGHIEVSVLDGQVAIDDIEICEALVDERPSAGATP